MQHRCVEEMFACAPDVARSTCLVLASNNINEVVIGLILLSIGLLAVIDNIIDAVVRLDLCALVRGFAQLFALISCAAQV